MAYPYFKYEYTSTSITFTIYNLTDYFDISVVPFVRLYDDTGNVTIREWLDVSENIDIYSGTITKTYNGLSPNTHYIANVGLQLNANTLEWLGNDNCLNSALDFTTSAAAVTYYYASLSFDANGGYGAPDVMDDIIGTSSTIYVTIPNTTPTQDGYDFLGWSYRQGASYPSYYAGGSAPVTGATNYIYPNTLHAVWQKKATYCAEVYFYETDGSIELLDSVSGEDTVQWIQIGIPNTIPTKDGYTFLGWSLSKNATTASYYADGTITVQGETSYYSPTYLYAVWKKKIFYYVTLRLYKNDGTTDYEDRTYNGTKQSITFNFPANPFSRDYYSFDGWCEDPLGEDGILFAVGTERTVDGSLTEGDVILEYHAIWTAKKYSYTLYFDDNGGNDDAPIPATGDAYGTNQVEIKIPKEIPTKDGYTFLGWHTSSTAEEPDGNYDPNDTVTLTGTEAGVGKTLYAVWIRTKYYVVIKYDANGGTDAPEETPYESVTNPLKISLSDVKPTREEYTFLGWDKDKTAKTATYKVEDLADTQYEFKGSTDSEKPNEYTLFAIWKENIVYGAVYIKNVAYIPYIYNGVSWQRYQTNIYTTNGWNKTRK